MTVNSPRRATARIVINNDADTDLRTVRIRTGDEKLSIKDAFNVIPSATPITVVPNSGARGQTLTVTITSPQMQDMAKVSAKLVTSPVDNLLYYGVTPDIPTAWKLGVR